MKIQENKERTIHAFLWDGKPKTRKKITKWLDKHTTRTACTADYTNDTLYVYDEDSGRIAVRADHGMWLICTDYDTTRIDADDVLKLHPNVELCNEAEFRACYKPAGNRK